MKKTTNFQDVMEGDEDVRNTGQDREYLAGRDLSKEIDYGRGRCPMINEAEDSFKFMQIDCDYYTINTKQLPSYLGLREAEEYPVLRMYGVTEGGNSVMAHIHQFLPYLYVEVTDRFRDHIFTKEDLSEITAQLNAQLNRQQQSQADAILHIEVQMKESVMFYKESKSQFLKIYTALPALVQRTRQLFEGSHVTLRGQHDAFGTVTYESNMPFALRFMIDNDIVGMQWIQIAGGKYILRQPSCKASTCQFEFDVVDFSDVEAIPLEIESKIAPLRILSFDIECSAAKGKFPTPDQDPVIQIANIVKVHGESEPIARNVFTLNTCAQIVGTHVRSFKNERELLKAWSQFIRDVDPDFITGYNTQNFDLPYLLDRANYL